MADHPEVLGAGAGYGARRSRHHRPTSTWHALRGLGRGLAALLSFTLLVGFGYGWYEYRSLNAGLQKLHISNLGEPAGHAASGRQVDGQSQNILVVGLDARNGLSAQERRLLKVGNANSLSTDTIMVIHVPADGSRATLISIPRDSFVNIPGYLKNKINAAYADGYTYAPSGSTDKERQAAGANTLVGAVRDLTGLQIDHYVQVGFGGFYTITKAIGSIPVDLCQATDDTKARNEAEGQGPVGSGFKMSAGHHDLTPVEAVEFVRQRHNLTGGDIAREKRQRYFLAAAFGKLASMGVLLNPGRLNSLIKAVTGAFYVDDNGFSIVDLANQMADLSANKITGYTIPTEGSGNEQVAGQSINVIEVNPAKVRRFVQQKLDGVPAPRRHRVSTSPGARHSAATGSTTSAAPAPAAKGCIN